MGQAVLTLDRSRVRSVFDVPSGLSIFVSIVTLASSSRHSERIVALE